MQAPPDEENRGMSVISRLLWRCLFDAATVIAFAPSKVDASVVALLSQECGQPVS
jgi:hypothetical protein